MSKRSSCSVHQGTKVSLAEECNPDTFTPRRVRQEPTILSPSRVGLPSAPKRHNISSKSAILSPNRVGLPSTLKRHDISSKSATLSPGRANLLSALRKLGTPRRSQHSPADRCSSASIPGSRNIRLFPGGIPDTPVEPFPSTVQKFPQES